MASSWQVTGDSPDQVWFVAGQDVTGHLITFITGNGNRGSVQVPDDQYTTARVKSIIQAKADVVDSINGLHEGTVPVTS